MAEAVWRLPQVEVRFLQGAAAGLKQLVVAGGRPPALSWLQQVAGDKKIYCADKGVEACLAAGLFVEELYGDGDSGSAFAYEQALASGTRIHRFPPAKDDTDLQLVLQGIPCGDLLCSGVWGGRFDHLYSNIFSLLSYKLRQQVRVCLGDEQELLLLLAAGEAVELRLEQQPLALSLLPLTERTRVGLTGVQWALEQAELTMLHPYAISNVPEKRCSCSCSEGALGLYMAFGEEK